MLSVLIIMRNAVIVALLSWLGLQAPTGDDESSQLEENVVSLIGSFH